MFKINKRNDLIFPIISLVLGILIIIFKGEVIKWAAMAFGAIIFVIGLGGLVLDMNGKKATEGILVDMILLIVGILMFAFAWTIVWVIRVIFGSVFIIYGFLKLFTIMEGINLTQSIMIALISILLMIIGVFIICDKAVLYYLAGGLMIADGVIDFVLFGLANGKIEKNSPKKDAIDAEVKVIREDVNE